MKRRIVNVESSYSYKNEKRMMKPEWILEKVKEKDIKEICVVDYANCASIPIFEKKKDGIKIGYGIYLNIRFDDLYVNSIILAKNSEGLKDLYRLVTKINKGKCYFISYLEIKDYLEDLILGIRDFDLDKDYSSVIKYYNYVLVNDDKKKNEVIKINDYCENNQLLLIALDTDIFISDEELLNKYDYLDNKEEVVINNSQKLMNMIKEYKLLTERQVVKYNNYSLRNEVYDRAEYVYFYGLSDDIRKRIDEELAIIDKYDLEGTIGLIVDLGKKAQRMGYKISIGGWLSNTIISYILGLTDIDVMELSKKRDLEKDIEVYGMSFQLVIPKQAKRRLIDYFRRLTNQKEVYIRGEYKCSNDDNVKLGMTPLTYYIIPNGIDILDYTPLDYVEGKDEIYNISVFDKSYLNKIFGRIYFRVTSNYNMIEELERTTNMPINCIPYNEKKVVRACYIKVESNKEEDYLSKSHHFYENYMMPELKLVVSEDIDILEKLVDLEIEEHIDWAMRVMGYYYLNYYKVHYPEEFYRVFLNNLALDEGDDKFIKKIEKLYKEGMLDKFIKQEENAKNKAIMEIIKRMLDLNISWK